MLDGPEMRKMLTANGWNLSRYGPALSKLVPVELVPGDSSYFPDEVPWLSSADWDNASFVTLNGDETELWLSVLLAKRPGTGALTRLLAHADAQGWQVFVPSPFDDMEQILKAKGYWPNIYTAADGLPVEVWGKQLE